jgi:hypothetical protein
MVGYQSQDWIRLQGATCRKLEVIKKDYITLSSYKYRLEEKYIYIYTGQMKENTATNTHIRRAKSTREERHHSTESGHHMACRCWYSSGGGSSGFLSTGGISVRLR